MEKVDTEILQSPPEEDTRKGPILEINGVESRWGSKTRDPTVVRILFNTDAGVISTQHINLKNTGTTAIFYAWKVILFRLLSQIICLIMNSSPVLLALT